MNNVSWCYDMTDIMWHAVLYTSLYLVSYTPFGCITEIISISELRTLVLDEADTLLDDSFNHIITSIFHKSEVRSFF